MGGTLIAQMTNFARESGSKVLNMGADALEHTTAVSHILQQHDEGRMFLNDYKSIYLPTKAQTTEALSKRALEIAAQDPAKPKINEGEIHTNASKAARHALLGPKDGLGVTLAASIEKKHGAASAQSFSNAVAFLLKDYVDPMTSEHSGFNARNKIQAPYSSFKKNVVNAGVGLTSVAPSYNPRGPIERAVTGAIYQTFSPLIAIPHIATTFNGLFGSDPATFLTGLSKSLGKSMDANIDKFQSLVTSGAFVESHLRDIKEWNQFKATGRPEFTGSGTAHLIYKLFHQPGFSTLRDYTLLSGSNVGKMTAEQMARDFVKNPADKVLQWNIKEFGLDPMKVIEQGGKLDESDLGKAVYAFVNKHYFLDNSLQRSMLLQSTWAGRLLGTYHGYVTRQAKLMYHAMGADFIKQGPLATAKNLAIGLTLFPAMGEMVKIIQEGVRGQDAGGDLKKDIQNISGQHGTSGAASTYFEAMGHVGAFGVYNHLLRGGLTHHLVATAAGPVPSMLGNIGEDGLTMLGKDWKSKGKHLQKNAEPVERDLAYDTPGVSLLAQVLMHRVLPKRNDKPKHDPAREFYHYMRNEDVNGDPKPEATTKQ